MLNPEDAFARNGLADASALLTAQQPCLDRLSRMAVMGDAAERARGGLSVDLGPGAGGAMGAGRVTQLLDGFHASGVGPLLCALPVGASTLVALTRLTFVAATVRSIQRNLGVDLLHPRAPKLASEKLRSLAVGPLRSISFSPALPIAGIASLAQLAAATGSLRSGMNVDILQPNAGARLRAATGQLSAAPFLQRGAPPLLRMPTALGLQQFSALTSGLTATKHHLGLDLAVPGGAARLPNLVASLAPNGSAMGALALPDLPQLHAAARLSGMFGGMQLAQQHLGVRLLDPNAGVRVKGLLGTLSTGQVCRAAQEDGAEPIDTTNLEQLGLFASSVETARSQGVDLLGKEAVPNLERTVDRFLAGGGLQALDAMSLDDEVLARLGNLGAIGEVARAVAQPTVR